MKLRHLLWVVLLAIAASGVWYAITLRNQPPEIAFAHVVRESVTSSVPTNGKVEPIEWAEARAEKAGPVEKILVQRGAQVAQWTPLIELDSGEARAALAAAQARVTQSNAELDVIEKGGRAADLTAISSDLDREKLDLAVAQKEYDSLVRLQAKQAATAYEVSQAKDKVDRARQQIRSLEQKRGALVAPQDRTGAEARLRDAESAVVLAQDRLSKSIIRAPISGTVYQFDLKAGAYLNAGDLVASIGQLDKVRVKVFVDEPDLGRVARGKPVAITWDAMPGRQWKGVVDKTPTQIVALGTRQVGEVLCVIANPDHDLLPGTNVNVDITAEEASNALTIPKEAVRRELGQAGVFTLAGNTLVWKKITLGISNTTRTQVEGLSENDAVALPSEKPLKDGMIVTPRFQ
ncbi:MAG: efflux RND transporter periplasmic adaptor subunit [Acidobacteriota bacterium]